MRYRIHADEAYFEEAFARYHKQHWVRRFAAAVKWIGIVVLSASVVMAIAQQEWLGVVFIATIITLLLYSQRIDRIIRARQLRRSPFINEDVEILLADAGFEGTSPSTSLKLAWGAFTSAVRFPDGWLLFNGPRLFRWLPDSCSVAGSAGLEMEPLVRRHIASVRTNGK
jgi:hypothetical protein